MLIESVSKDRRSILPKGTRIERCVIGSVLGEGRSAIVYGAQRDGTDSVAVKQLAVVTQQSKGVDAAGHWQNTLRRGRAAFEREAAVLRRLDHPSIVRCHGLVEDDGQLFLIQDRVEGLPLSSILAQRALSRPEVTKLAQDLVAALAHLHAAGIVHRDLAPDNIIVPRHLADPAVLIDFGSATPPPEENGLSHDEGGPDISPKEGYTPFELYGFEQTPYNNASAASDIYALGAVLYEAVTGKRPQSAAVRARTDTLPSIAGLKPEGYSAAFLSAIDAALSIPAWERPQSAEAWRQLAWPAEQRRSLIPAVQAGAAIVSVAALSYLASPLIANGWEKTFWSAGHEFSDCAGCPKMIVVPSGSFVMGSPEHEKQVGREDTEGPEHKVVISERFAVGRFEVTRREYARFVQETGRPDPDKCFVDVQTSQGDKTEPTIPKTKRIEKSGLNWQWPGFPQDSDNQPVVCVNWHDAQDYVAWLSRKSGKTYRLLSEAEWEYAARGGTTAVRFWGNSFDVGCNYANIADKTVAGEYDDWATSDCSDGQLFTAPVGSRSPNAFGLFDMLGNASEWTQDCWNKTYDGAPSDGSAWEAGDCQARVGRGGSWRGAPSLIRSAHRGPRLAHLRGNYGGFRVARSLQ